MSHLPSPTKPLHKPVPGDLLRQPNLSISANQREKLVVLSRDWEIVKAGLTEAMGGYQPRQGRLDQVQEQLGSYSDLSRQYEAAREAAWDRALRVLDAEQAKKVVR